MTPTELTEWREAYGGRRFLLTLGAGIVDTLLLWFGKLDATSYVTLTMGTVGVYIGAAVYEKVKNNVPASGNSAPG